MIHIQSVCIYRINIQAVCMQQEKKTNKARSEQTRAVLIDAARGLFASAGYAETSTPDIVRAAGVTRGALYHHFEDKEALFAAVVTAEFQQVAADIDVSGQEAAAPVAALMAGSRAFLRAMQVQTHAFQLQQHLMGAAVDVGPFGFNAQFGVLRARHRGPRFR